MTPIWNTIIIGGGAAGFFTAINLKEQAPNHRVLILEKGKELLKKVAISGGGRCNVTHACFEPRELVKHYPRGEQELRGPFHQFCTGDMMGWLDDRGVPTKIEEDNRVFPASNSSQSIIDCFMDYANKLDLKINLHQRLDSIHFNKHWHLLCGEHSYEAEHVVFATGSSPQVWQVIERDLGHRIISPVPSLFTFNCKDTRIESLMGLSVPHAQVKVKNEKLISEGPLLITHWGFSGPAILKLSAWGALQLNKINYQFDIQINWLGHISPEACIDELVRSKNAESKKMIRKNPLFDLPKRLWENLVLHALDKSDKNWADISKAEIQKLRDELTAGSYSIKGKSTFKDEFVTAGGVELSEINFKRFESKLHPRLYFAGEVLNIDAITGGFNFQAAWTGAWIIAKSIAQSS